MTDLLLLGRQMAMLKKQFEMATRKGDEDAQGQISIQMLELGERAINEGDRPDRFVIYAVAVTAIFQNRLDRGYSGLAGDVAFEALQKLKPLAGLMHQEQPATIITQQLNYAILAFLNFFEKDLRDGNLNEYQDLLLTELADLLQQSFENLKRIRPSNPVVEASSHLVGQLERNGITGNSSCQLDELEDLIDEMSEVWESLRMDMQAKDLDLRKNMSESFNPEINLKNLKASADAESPTAEAIDATIAPLFDRFKDAIDYEQVEEKLVYEDISKALYGSGFLRFYLNFAYYYNLYCRQNGMAQALPRELRIDEAIPFFPMAKAQELRRLVRQCFLALRGRTANEMFENLIERMARGEEPNGEEMLDLAEKLPDESMQGIVVSFVMVNFETEGIEIFNEKLYWQLKGLEFEEVATLMNQLLDVLQVHQTTVADIPRYTGSDVQKMLYFRQSF